MSSLTHIKSSAQETCRICLENFEESPGLPKKMPCNHLFHKACITPWLELHLKQGTNPLCPLCKRDIRSLKDKIINGITVAGKRALEAGGSCALGAMFSASLFYGTDLRLIWLHGTVWGFSGGVCSLIGVLTPPGAPTNISVFLVSAAVTIVGELATRVALQVIAEVNE